MKPCNRGLKLPCKIVCVSMKFRRKIHKHTFPFSSIFSNWLLIKLYLLISATIFVFIKIELSITRILCDFYAMQSLINWVVSTFGARDALNTHLQLHTLIFEWRRVSGLIEKVMCPVLGKLRKSMIWNWRQYETTTTGTFISCSTKDRIDAKNRWMNILKSIKDNAGLRVNLWIDTISKKFKIFNFISFKEPLYDLTFTRLLQYLDNSMSNLSMSSLSFGFWEILFYRNFHHFIHNVSSTPMPRTEYITLLDRVCVK